MASLAGGHVGSGGLFAAGSDTIRIGVIGAGGRGTGAAIDAVKSSPGSRDRRPVRPLPGPHRPVAQDAAREGPGRGQGQAGDVLHRARRLQEALGHQGHQLYRHGRPARLPAHPSQGRRSRPARTSSWRSPWPSIPVGIRSVIASSELAASKGLAIVAGTQRRHQKKYLETMKRIHDGAIGEIVGGQCYWNQGELWVIKKTPEMSDMEWQCRNWLYFTWTSGDHIVEQHVHNIDVMNWAFDAHAGQGHGHGRAPGPDGAGVRQHLRPLRRRVRIPERRPGRQPCAARSRAAPTASRRRSSGPRATPSATARSPARTPGSSRATSPTPTSSSTPTSSPASAPASRSTRASESPRARSAPSWAA